MTATVSFERQLWEYIQRVCPSPEDFVTFIVVTIAIIRIIQLVRASPRVSSIFAGCWVVWLITAGFDDRYLIPRFKAVISTTRVAVQSSATASLAWLELVLPFASDVLRLSVNLYEILPWQGKVAVVILSASLYGIFAAVTKVREKGDIIVYALYQFSYIVVAPALYYGFKRLPQTWIPSIISSIIYVLPVILSLYHFHGAKTDPRSKHKVYTEMWLSYFSLYPLIVILKDAIEKTSLDTHSFHLTLVPVIIWAQFWSGSRICFEFIRKLISLTIGLVPQVYSKVFNREITLPSQIFSFLKRFDTTSTRVRSFDLIQKFRSNLIVSASLTFIVAGTAMYFLFQTMGVVGNFLAVAIQWFLAFKSATIVRNTDRNQYEEKLSIWIVTLIVDGLTLIPIFGWLVSFWKPLIIAMSFAAADYCLYLFTTMLASLWNFSTPSAGKVKDE